LKTIDLAQRSPEWIAWKKHKIGSTSISILMGMNPYEDIEQMWFSFNSDEIFTHTNAAMQHGNDQEDTARAALEKHVGEKFTPVCGAHNEYDFISVSLDGITDDGKIIAEIKNPFTQHSFYNSLTKPSKMYYSQMQHQLLVSGAEIACFWSYFKGQHALHIIKPDIKFQEEILVRAKYFYDCFLRKEKPEFERFSEYVI